MSCRAAVSFMCFFPGPSPFSVIKCSNVSMLQKGGWQAAVCCGEGEEIRSVALVFTYLFCRLENTFGEAPNNDCPRVMQMLWNVQSETLSVGSGRVVKDKPGRLKKREVKKDMTN